MELYVNRLLTFISFDNYSRTSAKIHMIQLQSFLPLYEKGDFIEQVTEQLYDAKADQFLADRFVGLAQNVAMKKLMATNVKNGSTLNATDLINPKSTITGETLL
jgi:methionyl-tRNA synthetase